MVLTAHAGNAIRLVAVDRNAAGFGLMPGLALADARARVPGIRVHDQAVEADRACLWRIADWCDRYTSMIAEDAPDGLLLEIGGSSHLFGGEAAVLSDLKTRLEGFGFSSRIAVAGTSDCARAMARFGKGGLIATGQERRASGSLSVAALQLDTEKTLALRRAGLITLSDLAACPRKPLAARFGKELTERLAGILGETDRPITPRRPRPVFVTEQRFADPIGLTSDISLVFDTLTRDLGRVLESHGQGGRAFEATFFRSDGTTRRIAALTGRPLYDPEALKRLFMMRLDTLVDPLDPGFGFDMIRLAAVRVEAVLAAQAGFEGDSLEDEAIADLIDRLTARFGAETVERFQPENSHIPERAARRVPAITDGAARSNWPGVRPEEPPLRPLLLFTPPQPVDTIAEVPDGPPIRFRWRRVLHEIASVEGPERIAPEWWRGKADLARDYYRVEDSEGRRFWLFRRGLYGSDTDVVRWYIHGLFA